MVPYRDMAMRQIFRFLLYISVWQKSLTQLLKLLNKTIGNSKI